LWVIPNKVKLVVHWHSDIIDQKRLYQFYAPIERKLLKRADAIIATSEIYFKHSLPLQQNASKVFVVSNMVDTNKLELHKEDSALISKIKKTYLSSKLILFIGRMVPYKGLEYLIEAADYFHGDYKVLLIGNGPLEIQLKQKAQHNQNIVFLGRVSNSELRAYLHSADIFAFPSITKNEAFGIALAEALYCGLPAVCFNIEGSGVAWVNQNNQTGFVVENHNAKRFAEAMNVLIVEDSLKNKMAEQAKLWAREHFMRKDAAIMVNQIYMTLMKWQNYMNITFIDASGYK
jgi:rhamnosyl/mannosyltransferase